MRKMNYKQPYMYDKISPSKIHEALQYLVNKQLFIDNNIKMLPPPLMSQQSQEDAQQLQNFIVEDEDQIESTACIQVILNKFKF